METDYSKKKKNHKYIYYKNRNRLILNDLIQTMYIYSTTTAISGQHIGTVDRPITDYVSHSNGYVKLHSFGVLTSYSSFGAIDVT